MKIKTIINYLEAYAPLKLQESYDNAGLLIGSSQGEVSKALITLDVSEQVLDEAVANKCGLIIAHHPVIFKGIKRLNGDTLTEKLIIKAIKEDIAIYAIHTNLDNIASGVNGFLAAKLGLENTRILQPKSGLMHKLVTFCPGDHAEKVREALFSAGAGHIGNYSHCSFNSMGEGSFRALEGSNPFVGELHKTHREQEERIETIVPAYALNSVIQALTAAHPYEEVAYDIYALENSSSHIGAGMIGELAGEEAVGSFLMRLKSVLNADYIRHNQLIRRPVKKIAFCGGSGSFLIDAAQAAGADVFITGDVKYHDFFEHAGSMTIVDAGHYETEQFTKELLHTLLMKKFPNFALRISDTETNPVSFL